MDHRTIRILLLEDNPGDARLLREAMRDAEGTPFELTHVERLADAVKCLGSQGFDVLLADLFLPDSHGTDTVKRLTEASPQIPVVVLTGTDDEAVGTEAVRCGAQDYLVKGQTDHRLLTRAIRYAIERKQAEAQVRELSQRLDYHVDHSPLAVIEWGAGMRLIRWSGEAERLFGWKAAEVLGKGMEDFRWIHEEDRARVAEVAAGLQEGSYASRFSANRNYRKDGSVVHCEWYNSSLRDASGKVVSVLSLVLDVTDRKQAEELLRQANAQLEQRVAERTSQLAATNVDLRAQMDAYQRLEAEVAKLVEAERVRLGMELHDNLCQQIAATGMLTATLVKLLREQGSPLAEMASRIVATLSQAAADAHTMARGLLPVQVEADGLMMALADLAQRTQELQGITCAFECAAPVPVENNITATYLFRIAQEAIHNAIKHGQARHIVVTLMNQDGVTLAIHDDGIGIPPEGQRSSGSGLRIMAYRARVIGATLGVERAAGRGTMIQCVLRAGAGQP